MQFGLFIIGDEILHGTRHDKHFSFFKSLLESKGFRLRHVKYLPDEPHILCQELTYSFQQQQPTFITGGIGATPDDHTRQAAAIALNRPLLRHPQAIKFIEQRTLAMGEQLTSPHHQQRAKMADFPEGSEIIPNPINHIAGFHLHEHYFLPGFPQMAHPMAEWVLDHFYATYFHQIHYQQQSVIIDGLPESVLTPTFETIEKRWPHIKTFSLPTLVNSDHDTISSHRIEFGLKSTDGNQEHFQQAWHFALDEISALGGKITPI